MNLNLGFLTAHLRLDTSHYVAGMNTFQQQLDKSSRKLTQFGAYMSAAVTLPLTIFGRKALKEFLEFDKAITRSMAVMGGASDQLRSQLSSVAVTLSTKVATPAKELAKGYFELGQAGYSAEQSIAALPITESFAYAGSMHLSQAVSYLTKSLRSLGMESLDPEENLRQMTRVADNLTFAAIESTAEIIDFSEAMKNAGPALRILNKDIEEGTAALMALANQGHVGSEAGTQLYMVYRDLQRANITQRAVWDKMKLSVYDTSGEMRNLADIIQDLETHFTGMSDEGIRTSLMMLGFQDRSLRATQALFGLSSVMRRYEELLKEAGDLTKKVQADYLRSFAAQLDILSNKLSIVSRGVGEILAQRLMTLSDVVTYVVRTWNMMNESMQGSIVNFGIFAALIGPVTLGVAGLIKVLSYTIGLWLKLGVAVFSPFAGIFAFIALAYTVRAVWKQGLEGLSQDIQDFFSIFTDGYNWLNEKTGGFLDDYVMGWREAFLQLREDWKETIAYMAIAGAGLSEGFKAFWNKSAEVPFSIEGFKKAWQAGKDAFDVQALSDLESIEPMKEIVGNYLGTVKEMAPFYAKAGKQVGEEIFGAVKQQLRDDFASLLPFFQNNFPGLVSSIQNLMTAFKSPEFDVPKTPNYKAELESARAEIAKIQADLQKAKEMEDWVRGNTEYERRRLEINAQIYQDLVREEGSYQAQLQYLKSQAQQLELNGGDIHLINKLLERQTEILSIQVDKYGSIGNQLHAAYLQLKIEQEQVAGPWYEFATTLPQMMENGFMNMAKAGRNWGDQMKAMLEEIYWEFVRIQFIKPIANALGQGFSFLGSQIFAPTSGYATVNPTSGYTLPGGMSTVTGLAEGGIAWNPQVKWVAEKEPELITPLSQVDNVLGGGGNVSVNVINESGIPLTVTKEEQYMLSDQRIIDVVVRRSSQDYGLQKALGTRR